MINQHNWAKTSKLPIFAKNLCGSELFGGGVFKSGNKPVSAPAVTLFCRPAFLFRENRCALSRNKIGNSFVSATVCRFIKLCVFVSISWNCRFYFCSEQLLALTHDAWTSQSLGETLLKKGYPLHELVHANPFLRLLICPQFAGFAMRNLFCRLPWIHQQFVQKIPI